MKHGKSTKPNEIIMLSDMGELPAYYVDEFRDLVCEARRRFDRLDRFSDDQLEEVFTSDRKVVDWTAERAKAIKALDRYSREAFQIISKLTELIHSVRDSKSLIELCDADHAAKKLARQKGQKLK